LAGHAYGGGYGGGYGARHNGFRQYGPGHGVFGGYLYHRFPYSYVGWGYGYPGYGYLAYGYASPYVYVGVPYRWYGDGSREYTDDACDPDSRYYDPDACSEARSQRYRDTVVSMSPSFLDETGEAPEALPDEELPPGFR
jgi:hypothetical protein